VQDLNSPAVLKAKGGSQRLVYYVFDLLYLDAFDLRGASLVDRKRVLIELLGEQNGSIKISEHLEGDGTAIWKRACDLDLEGIVSKRAAAPYSSGRTSDWIKATAVIAILLRSSDGRRGTAGSTASILGGKKMARWSTPGNSRKDFRKTISA
jgi:ATP-dependent DNA ligase